jgi:polyhydroxybutyrate depolymerase
MLRTLTLLAVLAAACGGGSGGGGGGDESLRVYLPPDAGGAEPLPLVVFLHGYGMRGPQMLDLYERGMDFKAVVQARRVMFAMPLGTKDAVGHPFWNGCACCDDGTNPDHVALLRGVIAELEAQYPIDPERVFVAGQSNGALMAHRMACEASDLVAGIAAISGSVWKDPSRCAPTEPVAVLQIHGTADEGLPYQGTDDFASAPASISTWAALNGCDATLADTGRRLDLDPTVAGAETEVGAHACQAGAAELWTMRGSIHGGELIQPDTTERIVDWLVAHPKH